MKRLAFILCLTLSLAASAKVVLVLKSYLTPVIAAANAQIVADEGSANFTPTLVSGTGVTWTAEDLPTGASINSSTGAITGTLSTTGHWETKVTATYGSLSDTIVVPFIVHGGIVEIGQSDFSSTPYEATTDDRVYRLTEDVTVDDSGIAILCDKCCIDLNGFTLTYNNDSANSITNQDFDNVTGDDPDDWTIEGDSSHTSVATASSYVYPRDLCEGANALRVTIDQGTYAAGTLTTGTPANIAATGHGLSTGDWVIIKGFSATSYGVAHESMIDGGYEVTRVDDNNFTINADVSAVSDGSGEWIKATCIESSPVSLPVNNRLYTATAVLVNNAVSTAYDCSIKVVNAADGSELEKMTTSVDQWFFYDHTYIGNGTRNFSPAVTCKSSSVANARVQIFLASESASVVVDVCRARLSQSYDNAVVYWGNNSSAWPQGFNVDTTGWGSAASVAIVDSSGGGSIEQGANRGFRGWGILLRRPATKTIIHGFDVSVGHDDTMAIYCDDDSLEGGTGPCTLANVDCTHTGTSNITRRFSQPSFVAAADWPDDVLVADCTMTDAPNVSGGFGVETPASHSTTVRDVAAYPKTVCTNSYAFSASNNSSWTRITVDSTGTGRSGRGFYIGASNSFPLDGVTLTDCTFRCAEKRHRESDAVTDFTRALRFRNQEDNPTLGTLLDVTISGCTFYCECTAANYLQSVQGARISIGNNNNGMDTANYSFSNCTFEAVNNQGAGLAEAIEIGRWDDAVEDLTISDSTFESNDCCLKIGGGDDNPADVYDLTLTGSTWAKDATSNSPRTFVTFRFDTTSGDSTGSFTSNTFGTGTAYDDVTDADGTNLITIEE